MNAQANISDSVSERASAELKQAIESSTDFRRMQVADQEQAATTLCNDYKSEHMLDLNSNFSDRNVLVQIVSAECVSSAANSSLKQKLIATIYRSVDQEEKTISLEVRSVTLVAYGLSGL